MTFITSQNIALWDYKYIVKIRERLVGMKETINLNALMAKLINELDAETVAEKLKEIRKIENRFSSEVIELLEKRFKELGA